MVKRNRGARHLALIAAFIAAACTGGSEAPPISDDDLKTQVEAALLSATDVPGDEITVEVSEGVVTLTGRLSSESMRGTSYPNAILQQSVGAVVRAVPGVKDVRFALQIEPGDAAPARPPTGRGGSPDRQQP